MPQKIGHVEGTDETRLISRLKRLLVRWCYVEARSEGCASSDAVLVARRWFNILRYVVNKSSSFLPKTNLDIHLPLQLRDAILN
ncbi:hypothetical protein TNCV_3398601 [Trichonephila clavipes]|nr:hypothetical protein TNCV_3398601 [Trichonephila clavipes]